MRKIASPAAVGFLAALALTGCGKQDQWHASTGSPATPVQPAAYHPSDRTAPGQLRGCLSGATDVFSLVEENSATVYRLVTDDDPEARPNARDITESLRLNNGKMVSLAGDLQRNDAAPGTPDFQVRSVSETAETCPAALQGAVSELTRPSATRLDLTHAGSVGTTRGSMRLTRPPVSIRPVNPAH